MPVYPPSAQNNCIVGQIARALAITSFAPSLSEIAALCTDTQIGAWIITSRTPSKDNNLLDYANQRDAFKLVETIKSPNDIYLFKSNIEDMQKYSNREDLKLAIEIYKNQGLKHFDERTDIMCGTAINAKIKSDICSIGKGKLTKGFDQKDYTDKTKYLCAISSDQNLILEKAVGVVEQFKIC